MKHRRYRPKKMGACPESIQFACVGIPQSDNRLSSAMGGDRQGLISGLMVYLSKCPGRPRYRKDLRRRNMVPPMERYLRANVERSVPARSAEISEPSKLARLSESEAAIDIASLIALAKIIVSDKIRLLKRLTLTN